MPAASQAAAARQATTRSGISIPIFACPSLARRSFDDLLFGIAVVDDVTAQLIGLANGVGLGSILSAGGREPAAVLAVPAGLTPVLCCRQGIRPTPRNRS